MALTINYALDPNTASAVLKRTVGRDYSPGQAPDDTVTLDVGAAAYSYADGVEGTKYGFMITATDSTGKTIDSNPFSLVYFEDTGPGVQNKPTRGYPDFGVFEFLTTAQFGKTPSEVRDMVIALGFPSVGLPYTGTTTGWYKCLVDGKIILIPKNFFIYLDSILSQMIPSRLISSGLISAGAAGAHNFDNCPIVTIGGLNYKWRGLKHWTGDLVDINDKLKETTAKDYGRSSEADMYMCLTNPTTANAGYDPGLSGASNVGKTLPPFVAGDDNLIFGPTANAGMVLLGNANWPNANGAFRLMGTTANWFSSTGSIYGAKMVPVLELVSN
ncbi:hypothetical protein [Shewanella phage FishSpeaker]|nr:hypothetical protein [Shewanella phage FishSpeaker]